MQRTILYIALFFLATGCNVGWKYNPPPTETPDAWKNATSEPTSASYEDFWWEVFNDPLLNDLEQQLLTQNYDLMAAYSKIEEARAMAKEARADLYPHIYMTPAYNNEGILYESYADGVIVRSHQLLYLLSFNLSYEADLSGKIAQSLLFC